MFVILQHPGPSPSSPTRWLSGDTAEQRYSAAGRFKATLLTSRAFCKHQLIPAAHGSAAVDSRKQLKQNTTKAVTAHSPNSNGHSVARERLQTEGEKFSLLPWERFQPSAARERRYHRWEKALFANCKPPVLCEHLSLSISPRALCLALDGGSDS